MEDLVSMKSLPPGFRFHPTDEELFMYYLKRKVLGKSLNPHMISDLDVYQFAPWDLPKLATLKTRDLNWFFFCPRAKKYPNGGRANRATVFGYWKSTGNDRTMTYNSRPVGKIKTLIFHKGKAPKGERTDWVMHEYRLEDKVLADRGVPQDCYVICKIYEKSGLGPKNGEHYGARFVEEEWESDDDDGNGFERGVEAVQDMGHTPAPAPAPACVDSPDASLSVLTTFVDTPNVAPPLDASFTPTSAPAVVAANVTCPVIPATAFVGNPYIAASVGMPNFTDASVGMPNFTDASMGMPNFTDASMGSLSAFGPNSVGCLSAAAASMEEDEIDRLLAHFTTEHMEDANDIYRGLLDLPDPHPQTDVDWNNIIKLDDLM